MKGWILNTIEAYETKQNELADLEGLGYEQILDEDTQELVNGNKIRYAGRIVNGTTRPDLKLTNGRYFIPHHTGDTTINPETDILTEE